MSNTKKGEEEERTQLDDSNVRVEYRTSHMYYLTRVTSDPVVGPGVLSGILVCTLLVNERAQVTFGSVCAMQLNAGRDHAVTVLRRSCRTVTWTV